MGEVTSRIILMLENDLTAIHPHFENSVDNGKKRGIANSVLGGKSRII